MIFLNPAVLFGLIAAAIPVLLHFLNLQRLRKVEFSTLSFLKELQKTKIRKLKFKQWLLLFLRVLIILLLVAAFARPTLESVSLGGSSAAKTTSVFILDNSYSMSVVNGDGTYLNKARQVIKNIVSQMQQGDEAVLLLASGGNENKKPVASLSNILQDVENASISIVEPDYESVFKQAKRILGNSDNYNKEVYIFSDFQTQVSDFYKQEDSDKYFDAQTRVYLFNYGNGDIANISVSDMKLGNQILEKGKSVIFNAVVNNSSSKSTGNRVASLFINGTRSAQQSFSLEPGGSQNLSFNATLKSAGLVDAEIQIEDDDINYDNERHALFYVPEKINVLILTDKKEDGAFVKTALMLGSESVSVSVSDESLSSLTTSLLEKNDIVIIVGSQNYRDSGILNNYIKNGRSVVLFPGTGSMQNDFKKMLVSLELPSPQGKIGGANDTDNPVYFDKVEYDSPLFTNLFENRKETKVESPEIYSYFKINPAGNAKPIISLTDNSLFLSEYSIGSGTVLLFNCAPLLSWSNFPVKSLFAPLMNKIVLYQTSGSKTGKEVTAGSGINVKVENVSLPQVKVVRPDKTEEFINLNEVNGNRYIEYDKTSEPGGYKFYSGDQLIDYASVNFDPQESLAGYLDKDDIEKFMKEVCANEEFVFVDPDGNYIKDIKQARFGTELWNYFLVLALIAALIEMFVARSAKKDITEIKKNI